MRRILDGLYAVAGWIAALFLCGIVVTVLIQVGFNLADRLAELATGSAIGLVLPSYAEFTGYFLVAATFFAAANALKAGAHIRVMLVLQRLPQGARQGAEVFCAATGAVFSAYFTWWTALLVEESLRFNDVSPGIVPVPIWIPQLAMPLGLAVLTVALIDEAVTVWRDGPRAVEAEPGLDR